MTRLQLWAVLALACTPPPTPASQPAVAHFSYRVDASQGSRLSIAATFDPGGSQRLVIEDEVDPAVISVEVQRGGQWQPVSKEGDEWDVPECMGRCTVRYELNLDRAQRGLDGVAHVGHSYLTPTYAWLVHPQPIVRSQLEIITLPARAPSSGEWTTVPWVGVMKDLGGGRRGFGSGDFGEGTYEAFGAVRARTSTIGGSDIEAAILDAQLDMGEDGVASWVDDAAGCVASLYGHFPVPHASIFLLPTPGSDEPVFGKVLSLGGASVVVLTGEETPRSFAHKDWILVHEMLHLGFPTFVNEGRWLNEGLSTYYEPVLRTRMGWRDSADMWKGLAREMPRGIPSAPPFALEARDSIDDVYWGGAIFVMMADIRIRETTKGAKSLDDVMRGVVAKGGDAEHVWSVKDTMKEADAITGTTVMTDMYERYAVRGEKVDLNAELAALGIDKVGPGDAIALSDERPRAWIRKQIVSKEGH